MSLANGEYTTRDRPSDGTCRAGCLWDKDHPGIVCAVREPPERNPKDSRISFLERKREATKADLMLKFEDGDYHGVQDCASDLRDIESELAGLRLA